MPQGQIFALGRSSSPSTVADCYGWASLPSGNPTLNVLARQLDLVSVIDHLHLTTNHGLLRLSWSSQTGSKRPEHFCSGWGGNHVTETTSCSVSYMVIPCICMYFIGPVRQSHFFWFDPLLSPFNLLLLTFAYEPEALPRCWCPRRKPRWLVAPVPESVPKKARGRT